MDFLGYQEAAWKDMSIAISGANLIKIRDVKYSLETEQEHLMVAGDDPISIQSGNRKPQGSIKITKGAYDDFTTAALAAGARDVTDVVFDINVSYLPSLDGTRPEKNDTFIGCKISKFEKGWEQGAKFMEIDMPFLFLKLIQA